LNTTRKFWCGDEETIGELTVDHIGLIPYNADIEPTKISA